MTLQQIIERLLRARLYRIGVVIRTADGENHEVRVRELQYEGSRSFVLVQQSGNLPCEFSIPLSFIERVADSAPPRVAANGCA